MEELVKNKKKLNMSRELKPLIMYNSLHKDSNKIMD
jgi:hypothetical protein